MAFFLRREADVCGRGVAEAMSGTEAGEAMLERLS
jgi:hypothetical protein